MNAIARFVERNLTLKFFLPLLALALAVTWYGLFYSVEQFHAMTGGLSFIDMQPTLRPDELFAQIRTYTPATVDYYIVWSFFDYAWPFITFTTMVFISRWLLGFMSERWRQWFWLFIASAYITVLFDWAENTGFIALVTVLPNEPMWLAQLTLGLHAGKLLLMMVFNLATWVLLLAVIVVRVRARFT
jgi:hypothetical protein